MASATPDLRLSSQPQGITAHWLVPNYTAWWQQLLDVNDLPRVALDSGRGQDSNPRPVDRKFSVLTTRPPSHATLVKSNLVWKKRNLRAESFDERPGVPGHLLGKLDAVDSTQYQAVRVHVIAPVERRTAQQNIECSFDDQFGSRLAATRVSPFQRCRNGF